MSSPAPTGRTSQDRDSENSLRYRQIGAVTLLFAGYAAYYFCRSDLSVALPLLIEDLKQHGMTNNDAVIRLGAIASFGVLAYALGKLFLTGLGDLWGGRRSFTIGLGGSIAFTLLFAFGGFLPVFTIAWIGNRLTQSIGWAGLIKVCSKWFGYSSYGTVIGILSLSYLVGDVAARQWMGLLILRGYGWRALFYLAASVAGVLLIANLLFLRESRAELGYTEPQVNPLNLFAGSDAQPKNFWELLKPLLFCKAFAVVCFLSLGCTIVRETFNIWSTVYLRDFFGYGASGRSVVMFFGLTATAFALIALASLRSGDSASLWPMLLLGVVAFCLLGPYSYLGGAFALDFGGSQAGAASSGLIDGVGYLGGVLAGDSIARLSVACGWRGVLVSLTGVTALSALAAGYLYVYQRGLRTPRA